MASQCPNCGKPVRSGAKFCGFCGHVLSKADPGMVAPDAIPQAGQTPPRQTPGSNAALGGNPCPHCGKNNRPGVKFCASCGKQLAPVVQPAAPPPSPSIPETAPLRKRPRYITVLFLVGVLVIVCASLAGIAYGFGWVDRFFPTDTPTATVALMEDLTETPIDFTQTPSLTPESTETGTPTSTITPSQTPQPTITQTPTPEVVFEDDYKDDLDQWEPWENRPGGIASDLLPPETVLGDFLDLKGLSYDKVGVTSVQTVTLASGMVIEFEAEVDNALNAPLYFDWYPGEEVRPYNDLGSFYLEIDDTEVIFHYQHDGNDVECQVALQAAAARIYQIQFLPNWEVILSVGDGKLEEVCRAFIDEPDPLFGRITFSGFGLVDRISITLP